MSIELRQLSKQYREAAGEWALHPTDLTIEKGEFFTLLGPSGCGKSTTLRLIAGFGEPTSGEVFIQGQPMRHIPAYRRPVNMVFQDYALFPHLTVAQNVEYGLRMKKVPKAERLERVRSTLELVHLTELAHRRPSQLSGGQRQRVALARALVNQPAVLLLDEPLGALDLQLRRAMQTELKHLQQQLGITFIYVTHDQEEALSMSDRIAVMREGRALQVDTPKALYEQPATRFVAGFVGESNFIQGQLHAHHDDVAVVGLGERRLAIPYSANGIYPGDAVTVIIRPEKLALTTEGSHPFTGTITEKAFLGTDTRYIVHTDMGHALIVRQPNGQGQTSFAIGDAVQVTFPAEAAQILVE